MRISDWSSDVCSSDLPSARNWLTIAWVELMLAIAAVSVISKVIRCGSTPDDAKRSQMNGSSSTSWNARPDRLMLRCMSGCTDRKSVVLGKSVSVRVDLGGRRSLKTKNKHTQKT